MSKEYGFFKVPRSFFDWEYYGDPVMERLYLYLMGKANHAAARWQGIEISRGQIVTGRKALAERLGFTEQQIRTALNKLKATGYITIKTTNKFSVVTLTKYEEWQGQDPTATNKTTSKPTNEQPTSNQQVTNHQPQTRMNKNNKEQQEGEEDSPPLPVLGEGQAAPTEKEVIAFFTEHEYRETLAKTFYNYYTGHNWHTKHGNTILPKWQDKAAKDWFEDKYKMTASEVAARKYRMQSQYNKWHSTEDLTEEEKERKHEEKSNVMAFLQGRTNETMAGNTSSARSLALRENESENEIDTELPF